MERELNDDAFLVRMPKNLLLEFQMLAAQNERSTAAEIRYLIRERLAERVRNAVSD